VISVDPAEADARSYASRPMEPVRAGWMLRVAPWAAGFFFALPVLIVKYPPMADLPLHEATVGLLRHWGDTRFAPPTLYFVNLGHANQLFTLVLLALSYVVPITWASKLGVAATLVALPVAADHFAKWVRAPRVASLLVAPLGLGWLFFWGLVQNILGIAALLAVLPAIDRFAARPTWRGAIRICGAMLLFHFTHGAMVIIAIMAIFVCSLGTGRPGREWLVRAAPVGFGVALMTLENVYAWRLAGPRHLHSLPFLYHGILHKVEGLPGVLFGGYETYVRNAMMLITLAPVALFVARRTRRDEPGGRPREPFLHRRRFEVLVAVLTLVYLAAPATIKSTTLFYHRFLPPAWAILAVCAGAGLGEDAGRLLSWLCAAPPVASLLIAWPSFADSDRVYSDLERLTKAMLPGQAVMALNLDPQPPYRLWNPCVAAAHLVAEHGGRSLHDYTQSPMSIVAQRPEKQWPDPCDRLDGSSAYDMRPDWDLTRFRYVLLVTPRPSLAAGVQIALAHQARLVGNEGSWYLFESILALVPIDTDDSSPPRPRSPTLRYELKVVANDLLKEIEEDPASAQALVPADMPAAPVPR